jgi:hypothetical protein
MHASCYMYVHVHAHVHVQNKVDVGLTGCAPARWGVDVGDGVVRGHILA